MPPQKPFFFVDLIAISLTGEKKKERIAGRWSGDARCARFGQGTPVPVLLFFLMNFAFHSELELLNRPTMKQFLGRIALVVDNYDDAIDFYVHKLKFELLEDTYQPEQEKRWVVVRPPGGGPDNAAILLAEGRGEKQRRFIGNQAGGRVFFFLYTDNFERDYANLLEHKVEIVRPPTDFPYGRVLVFADLYGNLWDLVEPSEGAVM